MIVIVDFQMGNAGSIRNMLKKCGVASLISSNPADIEGADKLILPGVGAFDTAIRNLHEGGLFDVLNRKVLLESTPILGICLGMQIMTRQSEEGVLQGLGWIDAETVRFRGLPQGMKVPHMGWNRISKIAPHAILDGLGDNPRFYFVHSYYVRCFSPSNRLASTVHGIEFTSAIIQGHTIGVQFHPEKSHRFGIRLLRNFADMLPCAKE